MSFYRGTSTQQDGRFKNKEKLIIDNKQFPKEYDFELDINKVEIKALKTWIEKKLNDILGFEDEFLINFIISLLENRTEPINPRKIQHLLTGTIF